MALSPYHLGTHRYEQTCVKTNLSGATVVDMLRDGSHSNVELRKNLTFRDQWDLYTYRLTNADGGPVNHIIRKELTSDEEQLARGQTNDKGEPEGELKL